MKALLIAPSSRPGLSQLAAEHGSLVLAPILGECALNHWLEHVAGLGARHVKILCSDYADEVRAAAGNGARWGLTIEVVAEAVESTVAEATARHRPAGATDWLPAPQDVALMSHLPGRPDRPLFHSYAGWFEALVAWMPQALTPVRVRVSEIAPGIWAGRRSRISPKAQLIAPCWIGDQVFVEAGAIVGPRAVLEDRVYVEKEAHVTDSWVGPDTLVGPLTAIATSLAWGDQLTNWRTDSCLTVPDPFLLSSLASKPARLLPRRAPVGSRQKLPSTAPGFSRGFSANSDMAAK